MAAFQYAYRMVCVVLWKAWRLRRHHKWRTLIEIAAPVLLVLLLASVKSVMEPDSDLLPETDRPTLYSSNGMKESISGLCSIGCSNSEVRSVLAYAPRTPFVTQLMTKVHGILVKNMVDIDVQGFETESEIEALNAALQQNNSAYFAKPSSLTGGVVFFNTPAKNSNLVYKIRLMTSKFITGKVFPDKQSPGPGNQFEQYEKTGFLGLQLAIDTTFLTMVSGKKLEYSIETQAMPYPPYNFQEKSHFTIILAQLLPSAIILGFAVMVGVVIKTITTEEETGIKQFMTMLGLSNTGYWFGWMVDVLIVAVITTALIVMILTINLSGSGPVLVYSSTPVIWTFLLAYVFASTWFCFFIATILDTSKNAGALGVTIWLASYFIPVFLVGNKQRFLATQLLVAVMPNMCLYWGCGIIAQWESQVVGVNWDNLEEYANTSDSLNLAVLIAMLVFDGFFFMILATFARRLDNSHRSLKSPYRLMYDVLYDDTKFPEFVRRLSRGCKCRRRKALENPVEHESGCDSPLNSPIGVLRTKVLSDMGLIYAGPLTKHAADSKEIIEETNHRRECGVQIRNVSKSFQTETVLRSVSCDFYKDEITCICGETGSGKSCLLKIILGIMKADEGTAYVNRYDINDYLTDARRSTNLCPQDDMLFEDLTVMEHLLLFSWLKGRDWSGARAQATQVIAMLKLKDKSKVRAEHLSHNDKRKLSLGISIIGDPKVILLDEITDGMDAESEKTAFNVIQKIKEGKTIIYTTEATAKAELIADRMAIMNEGSLRCYGSPDYLRKTFGSGYTIKLCVAESGAEKLVRMITSEIRYAEVKHRVMTVTGEDITLVVPDVYAPLFPKMFSELYDHKDDFGIQTIDIHTTTVEEIFYNVREMKEFKSAISPLAEPPKADEFFVGRKLTGFQLGWSRLVASILKNYWMTRSNIWAVLFQILFPLCLIIIGITGANRGLRNRDVEHYSQINIKMADYDSPITMFSIPDPGLSGAFLAVVGPSAMMSPHSKNASTSVLAAGTKSEANYRHQYIVAVEQNDRTILSMYNTVPCNSPPLAVNLVTNTLLKKIIPFSSISISVENHPLRNGSDDTFKTSINDGTYAVIKSLCFYFAFAVAINCAMVAVKPMKERVSGTHHLQTMTGISPLTFWSSYAIVDGLFMLLFAALAVLITFICQERYIYTMYHGAVVLFTILIAGGFASLSFAYLFSQFVNNAYAAFGWLNVTHILVILGSYLLYEAHDGITNWISELFYWISLPFPVPLMVHTLFTYSKIVLENSRCEVLSQQAIEAVCSKNGLHVYLPAYSCCDNCTSDRCFAPLPFFTTSYGYSGYTILRDVITMGLIALAYFVLVILMDYRVFQKLNRYFLSAPSEIFVNEKFEKDPSAAEEADWVQRLVGMGDGIPEDEALLLDGLCKNYGTVGAYSNISFSVKRGECFGLIGLDGAGKTSLFETIVGKTMPAVGDAYLPPYSMLRTPHGFTSALGYCPQKDSVLTDLTGKQMLQLFGSLKGICKDDLAIEVRQWLSALGLENDAEHKCKNYTTGMRRRLCVAIALIGDPQVVILDEPSREMDAQGQKLFCQTLQKFQKSGKSVVLTSMNVAECETLCGRVGLLINGRLQYIGSTREIKSKFLNGYTVIFKLKKRFAIDDVGDVELVGDIKGSIDAILGDGVFREAHQNTLKYLIPERGQNWGSILEKLEKIRTTLPESIDYYCMKESTLEEVFAALKELDSESTNELTGAKVSFFQRCLMGQCCYDDYS